MTYNHIIQKLIITLKKNRNTILQLMRRKNIAPQQII